MREAWTKTLLEVGSCLNEESVPIQRAASIAEISRSDQALGVLLGIKLPVELNDGVFDWSEVEAKGQAFKFPLASKCVLLGAIVGVGIDLLPPDDCRKSRGIRESAGRPFF